MKKFKVMSRTEYNINKLRKEYPLEIQIIEDKAVHKAKLEGFV